MPIVFRQRLFRIILLSSILNLLVLPLYARTPSLRWEKIHVFHVAATTVFARLGLTHSTKNGHTRDGKHGVADPNFPPGLTDVVPNDAERVLLARGTDGGLSLFRSRVAGVDTSVDPLHLKAQLTRRDGTLEVEMGTQEVEAVSEGLPCVLTLGEGDARRVYQITMRTNIDGSLWLACRVSLPLPPAPAAVTETPTVFVPDQVWTDPLSRKIKLGETAVFEDNATFRHAAGRRLGLNTADSSADYIVRVTLTPLLAALPTAPLPTAPLPTAPLP